MYPERKSQKPQNNRSMLLATIAVLVIGFILIIAAVFIFSAATPSLLGKCVAVVNLNQEISTDGTPASLFASGSPGSEETAEKIHALESSEEVGAVVFVVNSPGGSVVATREIYDSVKNLSKPKVAYFREVAASGAYYVSTGTDYIISDPNAITGSIGVIATFTELSGLFDKVGINTTAIKSGEHKDIGSPSRPMTDNEKTILNGLVREVFEEFKGVVMENRKAKLNLEKFQTILDGRIVSGRQAKEIGLVDALGTKKDAIAKAALLAHIEDKEPKICEVSLESEDTGLFNLDSVIRQLSVKKTQLKLE